MSDTRSKAEGPPPRIRSAVTNGRRLTHMAVNTAVEQPPARGRSTNGDRTAMTSKPPAEHLKKHAWSPGQSGNPAGRPKNSRNKLGEAFIADLHDAWLEGGSDAIRRCMEEKPAEFIRIIASLIPKELDVTVDHYDHMSDEQLRQQFAVALRECAALGLDLSDLGLRRLDQDADNEGATEGYTIRH